MVSPAASQRGRLFLKELLDLDMGNTLGGRFKPCNSRATIRPVELCNKPFETYVGIGLLNASMLHVFQSL